MRPPTFTYEREIIAAGHLPIGVDEAGCGCLAGPVVAAALCLPLDLLRPGRRSSRIILIRDSKLLSAGQRERIVVDLHDCGAIWATGSASPQEIDRLNIRRATYLAMRRAVRALLTELGIENKELRGSESSPSVIHDSLFIIPRPSQGQAHHVSARPFCLVDAWHVPNLPIPQRAIIHGDRLVKSIAAASIIAKVTRDALMRELDREYPQYGFAVHKGYATAQHRAMIHRNGLCPVHRRSFCAT